MQTLVPIGTFENRARELLGDSEFEALLELLAKSPRVGRVIQSTGGLRKVRIARKGTGKSSGTRVIYYYHNESKPILLLLIYAKADQDSLTAKQKQVLRKLVEEIIDELR
jgi:hypothetical protein